MAIVKLTDVKKTYPLGKTEVHALKGVSLEIEAGDFVSIAGPSGSGKSTLLNLIGCIDTATSGQVSIGGVETSALNDKQITTLRHEVLGFVFQSFNLIPVLNVFKNVEFPLLLGKSEMPKSEQRAWVDYLIDAVGLRMVLMKNNDFVQVNRDMWNQTANVYKAEGFGKLLKAVGQPNFTTFDEVEFRVFSELGLEGKDVAQLGCNNGRELINVKKAGASRCVGFDVSENFLEQASQLARASGLNIELVHSSVYDIAETYDNAFDIVYITVGILGWLPDLPAFFKVIERLLRSSGYLFLYDQHPVLGMFDPTKVLEIDSSYFRKEPFVDEALPDYMDPTQTGRAESYWFQHTLSSIIGLCLRSGLHLTHFEEYGHDLSNNYRAFQEYDHKPPLSYSLVTRKE